MSIVDLERLGVDLTPVVPDYTGVVDEDFDWDPIADDSLFDLTCEESRIPAVVSKGAKTPFRMSALGTWDQGCVEVEVAPNLDDFTEEEWRSLFGEQFTLINRQSRRDRGIEIAFDHPRWGEKKAIVSLEEDDRGDLRVAVSIEVGIPTNARPQKLVGYVPVEAVTYREHLTWFALDGLNHYGWKADEADRIREECDRWNSTQWVEVTDTVTEVDLDWGDDDNRRYSSTSYERTRWKDPTGSFPGLQGRIRRRNADQEIENLFPRISWLEHWTPVLLPQWEKEFAALGG